MDELAEQLLKENMKPEEVARALNEQGFRNSQGHLWHSESVSLFRLLFVSSSLSIV